MDIIYIKPITIQLNHNQNPDCLLFSNIFVLLLNLLIIALPLCIMVFMIIYQKPELLNSMDDYTLKQWIELRPIMYILNMVFNELNLEFIPLFFKSIFSLIENIVGEKIMKTIDNELATFIGFTFFIISYDLFKAIKLSFKPYTEIIVIQSYRQ